MGRIRALLALQKSNCIFSSRIKVIVELDPIVGLKCFGLVVNSDVWELECWDGEWSFYCLVVFCISQLFESRIVYTVFASRIKEIVGFVFCGFNLVWFDCEF